MKPIIKKLDTIWAQLIKLRAKERCEICSRKDTLNSHHIFSRSSKCVRHDLDNGACLCALHHCLGNFSAHKSPIEFIETIKKKRGEKWYKDLRLRWNLSGRPDYKAIEIYLKSELEKYLCPPSKNSSAASAGIR